MREPLLCIMHTCDELGTPIAASSIRFHTSVLECSHSASRTDCAHEPRLCLQTSPVGLTVAEVVWGTCSQHVGTPIRAQVLVVATFWPPGCDLDGCYILRDDPTTVTSTRTGDHVRVNHTHPRCGIDQWSV